MVNAWAAVGAALPTPPVNAAAMLNSPEFSDCTVYFYVTPHQADPGLPLLQLAAPKERKAAAAAAALSPPAHKAQRPRVWLGQFPEPKRRPGSKHRVLASVKCHRVMLAAASATFRQQLQRQQQDAAPGATAETTAEGEVHIRCGSTAGHTVHGTGARAVCVGTPVHAKVLSAALHPPHASTCKHTHACAFAMQVQLFNQPGRCTHACACWQRHGGARRAAACRFAPPLAPRAAPPTSTYSLDDMLHVFIHMRACACTLHASGRLRDPSMHTPRTSTPYRHAAYICSNADSCTLHARRLRDPSALGAGELLLKHVYGSAPDWDGLPCEALLQLAVVAHDHGMAPLAQACVSKVRWGCGRGVLSEHCSVVREGSLGV